MNRLVRKMSQFFQGQKIFFFLTHSPKHKDIQFTIVKGRKKTSYVHI